MQIKTVERLKDTRTIEVGGIFHISGTNSYLKLIGYQDEDVFALYDLETDMIVSEKLNHINHVINHVRKHYGDFVFIPEERILLNIEI